jgi:hypothetical protein
VNLLYTVSLAVSIHPSPLFLNMPAAGAKEKHVVKGLALKEAVAMDKYVA